LPCHKWLDDNNAISTSLTKLPCMLYQRPQIIIKPSSQIK
jgi:hypothetical protein